jgi:DNA-directed RNA polymerase II subunit RPB1
MQSSAPLKRATFEQPVEIFHKAAVKGIKDHLQGISEQLLVGIEPACGSHYNSVIVDPEYQQKWDQEDWQPPEDEESEEEDLFGDLTWKPQPMDVEDSSWNAHTTFATDQNVHGVDDGVQIPDWQQPAVPDWQQPAVPAWQQQQAPAWQQPSVPAWQQQQAPAWQQQQAPASPAYSPASPADSPASPAYYPAQSVVGVLKTRAYSPASPAYSPTSPNDTAGAYSPASPAYSPTSPNDTAGAYSPTSPAYSPDKNVQPTVQSINKSYDPGTFVDESPTKRQKKV